MTGRARERRWNILLALLPVLLAVALRLPSPPEPEAADPWIRGALAIQGLNLPGDVGEARRDLVVSLPLGIAQNIAFLAARITSGEETGDRGAWIRSHGESSASVLWGLWIAAAAAAALLAARVAPRGWGLLAGLLVAIVPIGLAGTRRLDGWALATPLSLLALCGNAGHAENEHRMYGPIPLGALVWGALLSLTPLGWILALIAFLTGPRGTRFAILVSIPLWFALDPGRLTDPVGAVSSLRHAFVFAGWPGIGDGPIGRLLIAVWTPGLIICLLALVGSWRAVRARSYSLVAGFLLLWVVPALLGARRPDAVGLIAPGALLLAIGGTEMLFMRSARGRFAVAAALSLLLIVPVSWGAAREMRGDAERRLRAQRLREVVSEQMKAGALLLRDPAAPVLPDSIPSFSLPTFVERPEAWDFAYWPGWYGGFSYVLLRARTIESIEKNQAGSPGRRSMLIALSEHADPIVSLGDPSTDRSALILFRIRPGPPWSPAAVRDPWEGLKGRKTEARFLADLGGFLAQHGKGNEAVEILRLALKWDDSEPKAWNNLGSTLLMMGEAKAAAETFDQGLRRDPSSLELRYNLAKAYLAGNIPGRAVMELRKVLQASPGFAAAHYDLARAAAAEENWPLAAQALEACLSLNPNAPNRPQIEEALAEARRRAETSRAAEGSRHLAPAGAHNE